MSNDEILMVLTNQIERLQQDKDFDNANQLDDFIYKWLGLSDLKRCSLQERGFLLQTYLVYLHNRACLYLNQQDIPKVLNSLRLFRYFCPSNMIYGDIGISVAICEADVDMRLGKTDNAKSRLYDLLERTQNPYHLARINRMLGELDNPYLQFDGIKGNLEQLSQALGYAEKMRDKREIAETYLNIGNVLVSSHPALGLSMIWQAQIIAERNGDSHQVLSAKLSRTCVDIRLMLKYANRGVDMSVFEKDAKDVVLSIDRCKLQSDVEKAFYDEYRGKVLDDDESLYEALRFFRTHHAYGKVFNIAQNIAWHAVCKKDFLTVRKMLDVCYKAAIKMNDSVKIKAVLQAMKQFKDL